MSFVSPLSYELYGKGDPKANFVEEFINLINQKHLDVEILMKFIQKDLIITLKYSDGSEVVFDRYYREIEENTQLFFEIFRTKLRGN